MIDKLIKWSNDHPIKTIIVWAIILYVPPNNYRINESKIMTERIIHCHICRVYVGTIRDARLMKGVVFTCPNCQETPKSKTDDMFGDTTSNPFGDLFGDTFSTPFGDVFGQKKR